MIRRGFFTLLLLVSAGAAVFFYQEYLDNNTVVRMRPPAGYPMPEAIGAKSPSVFEKLANIEKIAERQEEPAPAPAPLVGTKPAPVTRSPITVSASPKAAPKVVAKVAKARGGKIASRAKAKHRAMISKR